MEPKLSRQAQVIMEQLKKDLDKRLLTEEQYEFLRKGMLLNESFGILSRFIIGLAAFVGAGFALVSYWPWGSK